MLIGGYTVQNTIAPSQPGTRAEHRAWYQWYFNTESGRAGLEWKPAAPSAATCGAVVAELAFTDAAFERTARSFDNPDFVDVVTHSYRHRIGNAPGEARFKAMEERLAARPKIQAPSITLDGAEDGIARPPAESPPAERAAFASLVARRVVPGVGHFMPREKPDAVSAALLELLSSNR